MKNNNEAFMSIVEKMITSNEEVAKATIEANQAALEWMYVMLAEWEDRIYEPEEHSITEEESEVDEVEEIELLADDQDFSISESFFFNKDIEAMEKYRLHKLNLTKEMA